MTNKKSQRRNTPPGSVRVCDWSVFIGLWRDAQIGFNRSETLGKFFLGILVGNCGHDDAVVAVLPVGWGGDRVVGRQLQRGDDAQNLVEVAARRGGIGQR